MRAIGQRIFLMLGLGVFLSEWPDARGQGSDMPARRADVAKSKGEAAWLKQLAEQQGVVTNTRFDVIFIGDSLTEFWTSIGKASWPEKFAPLKCANCGISGDRAEHVLYRISRLDFRRATPRAFVLLMGTNNLGMENPDKPEDVARAILNATAMLTKRHPQSKIVILGIPPSGVEPKTPLRESIKQTDALLAKASLPAQASFISTYDLFADEADRWREGLTLDGTHFSAAGYTKLADLLVPKLKELLGEK